jgi:DNA-nicking Smr family endonuclease
MPAGSPPGDGDAPDDDAFAEAMRGARPLSAGAARITGAALPTSRPTRTPQAAAPRAPAFFVERTEETVSGRAADVGAPVVRALRRGDPPVAARLDLHGRAAADVPRALDRFFTAARTRGARAALVIHGRGQGSEAGHPVLRPAVWDWLATSAAASVGVMAFSSAAPRDGGAGATVVLLRRAGR